VCVSESSNKASVEDSQHERLKSPPLNAFDSFDQLRTLLSHHQQLALLYSKPSHTPRHISLFFDLHLQCLDVSMTSIAALEAMRARGGKGHLPQWASARALNASKDKGKRALEKMMA
jgi:hypothetical protein